MANKITLSRMLICPIIFFSIIYFFPKHPLAILLCLATMIISEIADIADGIVARKRNEVSQIGKLLDPLSDSFWHNIVFVGLVLLKLANPWLLFIMIARDTAVLFVRFSALLHKKTLAARISGKIKCHAIAYYSLIIMFLYLLKRFKIKLTDIHPYLHINYISYLQFIVALIVLYSMYDYLYANKKVLSLK